MKEHKYLTFPIILLKDGLCNISQCLDKAMDYCLYTISLNQEGDKLQRIKSAAKFLGLSFGNINRSFANGEILHNSIDTRCPKTSISVTMIFDFYLNNKTEFEIATFFAFAAIKSIIQKQGYTKITNDYLIGRMSGNAKAGEPISDSIFKFNNRYQIDKIKKELELNWGLQLYARHTRGFYVSFTIERTVLIRYAEMKRKLYKEKELQAKKKSELEEVLRELNTKPH